MKLKLLNNSSNLSLIVKYEKFLKENIEIKNNIKENTVITNILKEELLNLKNNVDKLIKSKIK